jgi:F-type H+-transporting ATPase subunit b
MQVDWFTVIAQIVNFLVLVALLKRFLYGPIIRAMDDREKGIAARMAEAEEKARKAAEEAAAYRRQRDDLERKREQTLAQAEREALERRRAMIDSARQEVHALEQQWRDAIRKERESFLSDMRQRAGERVCAITARIMRDLAGEDLQDRIVAVFLNRLQGLGDDDRRMLGAAVEDSTSALTVRSAFAIPEETRRRVASVLEPQYGQDKIRFETADDLICGIEIRAGGHKVGWNVRDYLDALGESLSQALAEETGDGD